MAFSIRAVSELTGISPLTLRNWEKRYGFPRPVRLENGYRAYDDEDVETLKKVAAHLQLGGRIADLVAEIRRNGGIDWPRDYISPGENYPSSLRSREELYSALFAYDSVQAQSIASLLGAKLNTLQLVDLVYLPILVRAGEEWEKGRLSVAQEHFISAFVRQQLFALMNTIAPQREVLRKVVMCTPDEELHEGGLLMLSVHMKLKGFRVYYLGPNCPASEVIAAIAAIKPDALCISISDPERLSSALKPYEALAIPVCVGGRAVRLANEAMMSELMNFQVSKSSGTDAADFVESIVVQGGA